MTLCRRQGWACCAVLVLAAGGARALEDKITLVKNKQVLTGLIKKDGIDEVQIEVAVSGSPQPVTRSLAPAEVLDVEYDVSDPDWREAAAAFKSGAYARAADDFQKLTADKDTLNSIRAEARPYAFYMAAESLYRAGRLQPALDAFEKFIADFKSSRYVQLAIGDMVDAAIGLKHFDKPSGWLKQLSGYGAEQGLLADYYTGQTLLAQGKLKEAELKFGSAATSAVSLTRSLALLGQANCALAGANPVKARDLAQQAMAAGISPRALGAAYVLIGDATLADADNRKLTGDQLESALLDAVLAYMRVQLLYNGDPHTEPRAYLKAGECFERLAKIASRATLDDRERAIAMYTRLQERFRNSKETALAAEHLNAMK